MIASTGHQQFDAIVIGSGISGGWAAKELTERGLAVLVLERGGQIEHGRDYHGEHVPEWKLPFNGKPPRELYEQQYDVQQRCYVFSEANRQFFNNDALNPYVTDEGKPFTWIRADVVGGRSLLWGRQTYRWCAQDFNANATDGHGIPWPIDYQDLAPWYSHVERFAGISGQAEGLAQLPDSEFLPPMQMNALEKLIKTRLHKYAPDITMTIGRAAILTQDHHKRAACHYCGTCERGCSTGSYFSTQSATLPAAEATGRLTLKPDSVVERLVHDASGCRIEEVHVINSRTMERERFSARLFFLCASTVGSTQILMNSASEQHPNGLGNRSGALGRYLMDHIWGVTRVGIFLDAMDRDVVGFRPNGTYIPRFRNLSGQDDDADFVRGYGYQAHSMRLGWSSTFRKRGIGASYKESLRKPGPWIWALAGFGEVLPRATNRMYLHPTRVDRFGIPQVVFDCEWGDNEAMMISDMKASAERILRAAGAVRIMDIRDAATPGTGVHEMGTARMGDNADEAVLNAHNQVHGIPNLFVTDGSCMTSSSCVNPSLTYMALTARACDFAASLLRSASV